MRKRWLRYVITGVATIVGFLVLVEVHAQYVHWKKTRNAIADLAGAQAPAELAEAVRPQGWFYPLKDDAWIAIWYRDFHSGFILPIYGSRSIARDSEGKWYESDNHFCGSIYGSIEWKAFLSFGYPPKEHVDLFEWPEEREKRDPSFLARDLDHARRLLARVGFVETSLDQPHHYGTPEPFAELRGRLAVGVSGGAVFLYPMWGLCFWVFVSGLVGMGWFSPQGVGKGGTFSFRGGNTVVVKTK